MTTIAVELNLMASNTFTLSSQICSSCPVNASPFDLTKLLKHQHLMYKIT